MKKWIPTVCVDFDGVIHSYTSKWAGPRIIPNPPVAGAFKWLDTMMWSFRVAILSTRSRHWGGRRAMKKWFIRNDGEFLLDQEKFGIWGGATNSLWFPKYKPPALLYIDDRAYQFNGVFPDSEFITSFKPWKPGQGDPHRWGQPI